MIKVTFFVANGGILGFEAKGHSGYAEYGKDIPAAFDKVTKSVKENVQQMTGLTVVEVNMNVNDVLTRAEYERDQNEQKRAAEQQRRQANQSGQYTDGSRVQ